MYYCKILEFSVQQYSIIRLKIIVYLIVFKYKYINRRTWISHSITLSGVFSSEILKEVENKKTLL